MIDGGDPYLEYIATLWVLHYNARAKALWKVDKLKNDSDTTSFSRATLPGKGNPAKVTLQSSHHILMTGLSATRRV
jgi:hypothetical protein